jgi:tRNA(Ile)-lysidine synthase
VSDRAFETARRSGLIREGEPLLVLLSGGADSTCLLDVAVALGARVAALHVNYGLREGADGDEQWCRELCERMSVPLHVERAPAQEASGNLQAWARELRYAHAERLAEGDYAAAHTASDQAETVLYRLAVSPGRRALLGMEPRRGRLVRPLLRATREDTREHCRSRGLDWREDPSNEDPSFARTRVRSELLPVLRSLSPAVERTIAETALLLRDEADVLERAVDDAAARLVAGAALPLAELHREPAAIRRLLLRRMAESAAGRERPLSREDCDRILALGGAGGTRELDLGEGLRAVVEYGTLRFALGPDAPPPDPVQLPVPGAARFGDWEVEARLGEEGEASVSGQELGALATVRSWREGDRMRPAGVGGSKTLQDLFTDRKVPRTLRRTLPVVEAGGEIVWVAGVAVDERFAAAPGPAAVGLSARRHT